MVEATFLGLEALCKPLCGSMRRSSPGRLAGRTPAVRRSHARTVRPPARPRLDRRRRGADDGAARIKKPSTGPGNPRFRPRPARATPKTKRGSCLLDILVSCNTVPEHGATRPAVWSCTSGEARRGLSHASSERLRMRHIWRMAAASLAHDALCDDSQPCTARETETNLETRLIRWSCRRSPATP